MKIYRLSWRESETGRHLAWFTNKREAESLSAEIWRTGDERGLDHIEGIEAIDFPTKRAAIVAWLNINLITDNG